MLRDVRYDLADGGEYVAEGCHPPAAWDQWFAMT